MGTFLVLVTTLVAAVILPTTGPGFKIKDIQDTSITLMAFEKNLDKAELFAKSFCDEKGKQYKLNIEGSRKYHFPASLNIYK